MTEVSSAAGTIAYQYDERGNLLSVTNHNGDVVSYTYDQYGNKLSMTYPDGRTVSYTYDAMNRMTSVVGLDGDVTRYTYDAAGRRVRTASGTLTTEYSYDSVGNLIRQETSGASEIAFSYSHNKNGYITGEKRTENGQTTESAYAYDALGQLTAFTQSTGYGERYAYDAAGNMLQKVITGTDGKATALSMQYNAGNQLIRMAAGEDSIAYAYDANGSMIRKTLTSAQYGTLTDTYTYDALDMLTGYAGYDGYTQQFTYDANGMRLSKQEKGSTSRSTLEELLRGSIAGLPDIVEPADAVEEGYEWATTEYLYDVTQEYYQVIRETRADNSGSTATAYAYGLERVAAYTEDSKTTYVYDGRGSVAQTITAPVAGEAVSSALPDISVKVQSFTYTAYGEQMGAVKSSGFTYNAEHYDAATGMLNLRARQFEPALSRFSQKDIVNGLTTLPLSISRYLYCINCPTIYNDPSGMLFEKVSDALKRIGESIMNVFIPTAKALSVSSSLEQTKQTIENLASAAFVGMDNAKASKDPNIKVAYKKAKQQIDSKEKAENRALSLEEKNKIFARECMISAIQIANEFGKNSVDTLSADETKNLYEYARYSNYKTDEETRKTINSNRESVFPTSIISPKTNDPLCAGYIYNAIALKGTKLATPVLLDYLKVQRAGDKKVGNTTTPQYAAFSGGITRTSTVPKNDGLIAPTVQLIMSLSNNEDITMKLPGDTDYIALKGSEIFNYLEQWDILQQAGVLAPNDILYIGDGAYNRYIDMHHVVIMDSLETYSGHNSAVINGSVPETYIQPYLDSDQNHRLYFVLLNSDEDMINQLLELYQ